MRSVSSRIALAMNSALWDENSNDHFIPQLDPSGETRDFVDYDSNLLAVAFGTVKQGLNSSDAESRIDAIKARSSESFT